MAQVKMSDAEFFSNLYNRRVEEYLALIDEIIKTIGSGGDTHDVLEIVGDALNEHDAVDDETIDKWEAARAIADADRANRNKRS